VCRGSAQKLGAILIGLEFQATTKIFRGYTALDQLTLSLEPGEILGFLGPNGAGKTTAIHLALGFLRPSSGGGLLLGKPFGDAGARSRLGFVPDQPVFFSDRASSSVVFAAALNGVRDPHLKDRVRDLIAAVGLNRNRDDGKKDVRRFSRGMQQRLALAQALVNDPELLILDEPASALDPKGVLEVRELLREGRRAGKSIFFSSHQLTEVEQICDRIAFLNQGRLVRYGTLESLQEASDLMEAEVRGLSAPQALRIFPRYVENPDTLAEETSPAAATLLRLTFPCREQRPVLEAIWTAGGEVVSLVPRKRTLEELFMAWSQSER
jgi:ABC-2 type transport system ATP-binding protein